VSRVTDSRRTPLCRIDLSVHRLSCVVLPLPMFAERGGHLLSGTFRSDDTVCALAPQHSFDLLTGRLSMTNVMGEIRRNFTSPLSILTLYFP
jgi:hypothetical protein